MDDILQQNSLREIAALAEKALSEALGGPVRLDEGEPLREELSVCRFKVIEGPTRASGSVIAKRPRLWGDEPYEPDSDRYFSPAWLLLNDWAGLQFLSRFGDLSPAPRFYAGERAAGLLIMEDLGAGVGLHDLLLGDDPAVAEEGLVELARLLGRMHALSIGRKAEYARIRDALGPRPSTDYFTYEWLAGVFHDAAGALGISPHHGADEDVRALISSMRDPGPFLAYTHGDPCPDNVMLAAPGMRLFDFEVGGFRHALTDGVYGRIHFPTCWCVNRSPRHVALRMEAAYRQELVEGCR